MMAKRAGWKAAAVLSSVALAASFGFGAASAFADFSRSDVPTLVYDGRDKAFYYRNVESGDLFASFDDLMPGDRRQQDFAIEAVNISEPVTLYVRASYDQAETAGIEDAALSVSFGNGVAAEGTVGDGHGMGEALELGSFAHDGVLDAQVELDIPTTIGNDSAGDERELLWTFTAQEDGGGVGPGPGPDPDPEPEPDPEPNPDPEPGPDPDPDPDPSPDPEPEPGPDQGAGDESGDGGQGDQLAGGDGGVELDGLAESDGAVSARSDAIAKTGDAAKGRAIAWLAVSLASLGVLLAALRRLRLS